MTGYSHFSLLIEPFLKGGWANEHNHTTKQCRAFTLYIFKCLLKYEVTLRITGGISENKCMNRNAMNRRYIMNRRVWALRVLQVIQHRSPRIGHKNPQEEITGI